MIVAIVPAKDRADSVGATVHALRSVERVDRVLVVDDGSTDATADAARGFAHRGRQGADVIEALWPWPGWCRSSTATRCCWSWACGRRVPTGT